MRSNLILFCCIFLIAGFLRLLFLDTIPAGFHGDEGWTIIEARRILRDGFIGFWSPAALGQAALPYYWTALSFSLFGESIFITRLSFTLLTVFSIPFFYLTVRILFSRNTALIAMLLLSTSSTVLAFSRRADFTAMSFPFFPAVFFFWKALKTNKILYFVLAGIFVGLLHHVYAAFWVSPFVFFLFLFGKLAHQRVSFVKRYGKHLVVLVFCYALIASPMFLFAYTHSQNLFARSKMISIFSLQQNIYTPTATDNISLLLHNVRSSLLMFNLTHDPDVWNIFSETPVLDPVTGIFFLVGFFLSFKYVKRQEVLFTYLFFLFFLSGSILTIDAPNYRRAQVSIFFSFIFAALGMQYVYLFLKKRAPFYGRRLLLVVGLMFLFGICIFNMNKYFVDAQSPVAKNILAYQLVKISEFVKKVQNRPYVYFFSARWSYRYETLQGLLDSIPGEDRSREFGKLSYERAYPKRTAIFILLPEYINELKKLREVYPQGESIIHTDKSGDILFASFVVPT